MAAAQLDLWRSTPCEKFLTTESETVFSLLAGETAPPPKSVNVDGWCENFGLHVWFSHAPTATLARAVEGYLAGAYNRPLLSLT
jgi:hypothetical protein